MQEETIVAGVCQIKKQQVALAKGLFFGKVEVPYRRRFVGGRRGGKKLC